MKNGAPKIEKGIPLPTSRSVRGGVLEILLQMQPGDSVLLPISDRSGLAAYMIKAFGKGNSTSRKEDEGHVRVWRIR